MSDEALDAADELYDEALRGEAPVIEEPETRRPRFWWQDDD